MTRERLEALQDWASQKWEPQSIYESHVQSVLSMGGPPEIRLAVARLLLERERAVKALKWEYEEGDGISQESAAVLAFVEEEA